MSDSRLRPSRAIRPWSLQGTAPPLEIVRGEGAWLITADGRRILDFSSGWEATSLGHGHPAVVDAIRQQVDRICWAPPTLGLDVREEYADALSSISPWKEGCRTWFVTGGGQANEDAATIARRITGRSKLLTAYRSYHGSSSGSAALTGGNRRWYTEAWQPSDVVHFWAPFPFRSPFFTEDADEECARALIHLENVIEAERAESIAAILIEPVVGSDGLVVYPEGYLAGLRALANKYGILLIFNEVVTGFGRVGSPFAAIRLAITPDLITFAKGASSACVPLGGVMIRETLASHFDVARFPIGQTHSGHALAMAAGLGTLKAGKAEGLFERAYEIEGWISEALADLCRRRRVIGDVRGLGALYGIETVRDRETRQPVDEWQAADNSITNGFHLDLIEGGLWLHTKYSISIIAPPLIMTKAELEEGIDILDHGLARLEQRLESA